MEEPKIIELKRYCDDRGIFTNIEFEDIKRSYIINNSQKGVVRAFHGHKHEFKIFYTTKGIFKFHFMKMDDRSKQISFTLSENIPQAIICPKGWYNGFVSLTDESTLVIFSSSTMEESKKDDYRLDYNILGEDVWEIKNH